MAAWQAREQPEARQARGCPAQALEALRGALGVSQGQRPRALPCARGLPRGQCVSRRGYTPSHMISSAVS